jgi:hypothetical protein
VGVPTDPLDHIEVVILAGGEPIIGEFNGFVPTLDDVDEEDEKPLSKSLFSEDGNKLNGMEVCFVPALFDCLCTKKKFGSS